MSEWGANQTEVLNISVKLGRFPERKVLEATMGAMPEAPIEILHDMARTGPWAFSLWCDHWGPGSKD